MGDEPDPMATRQNTVCEAKREFCSLRSKASLLASKALLTMTSPSAKVAKLTRGAPLQTP